MAGREPTSGSLPVTSRAQSTECGRLDCRFHPPTSRGSLRLKIETVLKTTEPETRERERGRCTRIRARGGRSCGPGLESVCCVEIRRTCRAAPQIYSEPRTACRHKSGRLTNILRLSANLNKVQWPENEKVSPSEVQKGFS